MAIFVKIPLGPAMDTDSDQGGGAYPVATNVMIDELGSVRRRPGMAIPRDGQMGSVPGQVTNLHVTYADALYAVADGWIYKVVLSSCAQISAGHGIAVMNGRPTTCETQSLLVYAAGLQMVRVVLADDSVAYLGGNPPNASHVIANTSRLICNNSTSYKGRVSYSDVSASSEDYTGHETWVPSNVSSAGVFSAEGKPDDVTALATLRNVIYIFGQGGTEKWIPNPGSVDRPYVFSSAVDSGTLAPHSIIKHDGALAYLDDQRRFVVTDGEQTTILSKKSIQTELDSMTNVSDCYGWKFSEGPYTVMCWTFPSTGQTYAFQVGGGWSRWTSFNGDVAIGYPVVAAVRRPVTGENLIGVYSSSADTTAILRQTITASSDAGTAFLSRVETGYFSHGTSASKKCAGIHLHMRRGLGATNDETGVRVSWSDRRGAWTNPIDVKTGTESDTEFVVSLRGLGSYKTRAWRFDIMSSDVTISEVYEEIFGGGQ